MVRIIKLEQHTETSAYVKGACIAADTKPEKAFGFDLVTGSEMLEVDTGDRYAYNEEGVTGSRWNKIVAGPVVESP